MTRRTPLIAVVGYLGLMTLFIYGVADRGVDDGTEWLFPFLVLLQIAVGFFVGRWWAVALPVLVVLISVPAGMPPITPDNAEPLPLWFGFGIGACFAAPLVALGVLSRKLHRLLAETDGLAE